MKVGLGTKYGIVFSILFALKPVVDQIIALFENVEANWGTADKVSLISGAAVAVITLLGRFAQAVAHIIKGNPEV